MTDTSRRSVLYYSFGMSEQPFLQPLRNQLARAKAAAAKMLAGLELGGERVWPGANTDLFVAHLSLYRFFATFAQGRRVLDAGCGSGYGSAYLAGHGAASVIGLDVNERAVRYARRRYRAGNLSFRQADLARLDLEPGSFDLVVASNVMEHLESPACFLRRVRPALSAQGQVIVAVPPITDEVRLQQNDDNPHHLSNLTIDQWLQLFVEEKWAVEPYRHAPPAYGALDFNSHLPSQFQPADLPCVLASRDQLYEEIAVTAVFVLSTLRTV